MSSTSVAPSSEGLALPRLSARFIGPDVPGGALPVLTKQFDLEHTPDRAVLRSTFLGIGVVRVNGVVVGDEVLEPGWQSYTHRLVYRSTDVTDLLRSGSNRIAIEVAPGWFSGRLGFFGQRGVYGDVSAAFAQLDGDVNGEWSTLVMTDDSWRWHHGPTLSAELYDGERFDARREHGSQASRTVKEVDFDIARLERRQGPPVRRIGTLPAIDIHRTPSGKVIVDFGRNIVGWVRLRVQGPAGTEVVLRHAEVLENGELGTRPLRSAQATDAYVLAGDGIEEWEPSFTFHGFRYVGVSGWPTGEPALGDLEAVIVHSDLERRGWFRTSHAALQQLHENVVASAEGNFLSIPMDCPQRDERLGWTGDIAVFAPTSLFLSDAAGFLEDWLRDVAFEQRSDGSVPNFVPEIPFPADAEQLHPQFGRVHPAVWGDATTMVPTALYRATGNPEHLLVNLPTMRRWVDGLSELAGPSRLRDTGFQFGDWLDPFSPPDDPARGATEPSLVATAYFAHSARLVAEASRIVGETDVAAKYDALASDVVAAFRRRFLLADGRLTSHSQTAYAIALCLDLLESDEEIRRAGQFLVELVRADGHRVGTGFVGTPLLLSALTRAGAVDDAYEVLLNETPPSWLYAVRMGATTIWERWDSMLPDGSINPGEMTSFNHYAFGAVADWMHRTLAGLEAASPGFAEVRVAPRPRYPVMDAGATRQTPLGDISVDWRVSDNVLHVEVRVPDGVAATVVLEGVPEVRVGGGAHSFAVPAHSSYRHRRGF